jgi:hypothetical protein
LYKLKYRTKLTQTDKFNAYYYALIATTKGLGIWLNEKNGLVFSIIWGPKIGLNLVQIAVVPNVVCEIEKKKMNLK